MIVGITGWSQPYATCHDAPGRSCGNANWVAAATAGYQDNIVTLSGAQQDLNVNLKEQILQLKVDARDGNNPTVSCVASF
jgi:hypothetical protein